MSPASPSSTLAARVPLLERDQVPDDVRDLYDKLLAERGVVPNMYKALANTPELAFGVAALLKPLMREGILPGWYKELIATRVASLNRCDYCISAHRFLAAQRGATPSQVASYDHFELGPFSDKEKAGFRYASLAAPVRTRRERGSFRRRKRTLRSGGDCRTYRRSRSI